MASKRHRPDAEHAVLREMESRGVYAPEEFDEWLASKHWSWQRLDAGDYGVTLEEALLLFVFSDPVRWCETFLVEPDTGDRWKFFDYQRESLRAWNQDVIHQDGAEVGKTREIVCMILWSMCTAMGFTLRRPWILVGAPQQTHLDEIILAIEEQVGVQEGGEGAKGQLLSSFWLKPKKTPHMMQRFLTVPLGAGEKPGIGRVYYRPAGHDGEAFRGVHVNGLLLMDEAAKLKRAVQWTEFWRAGKPGHRRRVYSVPDGDRNSDFYRLTQQAKLGLPVGQKGWRAFRWPKTIMPAPFWSADRDLEFVGLYGSRQSAGYVRNVLGDWGDAENPVFSWDVLLPNITDLPEFRVLSLKADRNRGDLAVTVKRIALSIIADPDTKRPRKSAQETIEVDTVVDLAPFVSEGDDTSRAAVRALLADYLPKRDPRGVYWAGADLGEINDPTEIRISREIGERWNDELRVSIRGFPYHAQCEMIYGIDAAFGQQPRWGVDLGSAGTAVVRNLQNLDAFGDAHFDERMTGFQFAAVVDCIGEDGNALTDPADDSGEKIIRAPSKHWATQCMTQRLQRVGYGLAYDTETMNYMTSHNAREGAKWPIYAKTNDHDIDARRAQMLRKLFDESGGDLDVFASGAFVRNAA